MKDCNQCGKCCIKYADGGLSATSEEIRMWEIFRPDIYEYVRDGKIWIDPDTDAKLSYCPFLEKITCKNDSPQPEKYTCGIYPDRPQDCRLYPTGISEMIRDECEMIEAIDLKDPKRAKIKLEALMIDSRPSRT